MIRALNKICFTGTNWKSVSTCYEPRRMLTNKTRLPLQATGAGPPPAPPPPPRQLPRPCRRPNGPQ
eukprot:9468145-Pyramimonas_sp.AAC.1